MTITAIILAAGKSERMGRPKALLDFDGVRCIDLVLSACRRSGVGDIIVVLGHRAGELAEALDAEVRPVVNANYEAGQTSSLKTGAEHLPGECEGFLVFPVDFPLVSGENVSLLLDAFRNRSDKEKVFIPSLNMRRGHPVLLARELRDELLTLRDDEPARKVILGDESRIHYVNVENPGVLEDMDTEKDYRRLLALYREKCTDEKKHSPANR